MKIKLLTCLTLSLIGLSSLPTQAQTKPVDEFGDTTKAKSSIDFKNIPVIAGGDWRSESAKIPWSVPVLIRDDFDGDYLAVLDRNYQMNALSNYETGIISNWSGKFLRIYSYDTVKVCSFLTCTKKSVAARETNKVAIKAGSQIFRLEGKNGNFQLSSEIAAALKNAPPGDTKIKVQFEGSGVEVISDIGKGTVEAWKTVYQDAVTPTVTPSEEAPKVKAKASTKKVVRK
jgi:hypothetical protein